MSARPFIEPKLRFAVQVPQAEERFTPSIEDTLELAVTRRTHERDIKTEGGIITNYIIDDEVIFDIEDDVASVNEINIIQEEIINAFNKFTEANVDENDIVVKAELVKVFNLMD